MTDACGRRSCDLRRRNQYVQYTGPLRPCAIPFVDTRSGNRWLPYDRESSWMPVREPPASPVLTTPVGSMSTAWASPSAIGQCSIPRGTTKSCPGPRATSPSRNWMVSNPLVTRNISSGGRGRHWSGPGQTGPHFERPSSGSRTSRQQRVAVAVYPRVAHPSPHRRPPKRAARRRSNSSSSISPLA